MLNWALNAMKSCRHCVQGSLQNAAWNNIQVHLWLYHYVIFNKYPKRDFTADGLSVIKLINSLTYSSLSMIMCSTGRYYVSKRHVYKYYWTPVMFERCKDPHILKMMQKIFRVLQLNVIVFYQRNHPHKHAFVIKMHFYLQAVMNSTNF